MSANSIEFSAVTAELNVSNFTLPINPNPLPSSLIQTLSPGTIQSSALLSGTLLVPQFPPTSDCPQNIASLIPPAVSSRSLAFPGSPQRQLVAFAPWVGSDSECNLGLFAAANRLGNVVAYITYMLDGSSTQPPDTGRSWVLPQNGNSLGIQFPIYAVPSSVGIAMMNTLLEISNAATNSTSSPNNSSTLGTSSNSTNLSETSAALNARAEAISGDLWAISSISVSAPVSGIPGLWVIVLCVVGVFLVAVLLISIFTRIVQRRRRNDLRRRILSGDADLAILGVKKVTVPESILHAFPLQRYQNVDITSPSNSTASPQIPTHKGNQANALKYGQASCAICLDDYTEESMVRVLPCGHIFHPECVDTFLKENSSLCPLCKRTVLPKGYCPAEVTNAMVRRDRALRFGRERPLGALAPARPGVPGSVGPRYGVTTSDHQTENSHWSDIFGVLGRRLRPQPQSTGPAQDDVELQPTAPGVDATHVEDSRLGAEASTAAGDARPQSRTRTEWARRRAVEMVDDHPDGVEQEEQRQARRPAWRKILSRAFGGL